MNTKQYCVFLNNLESELQKRIKQICEKAGNKSKIYSDIANAINVLETDGDIIRSAITTTSYKDNYMSVIKILKDQKYDLDTVLNLYKSSKLWRETIDNDYFFRRYLENCVKNDKNDDDDDDDVTQYLGGRKKTKRNKKSKKNKKNKKSRANKSFQK